MKTILICLCLLLAGYTVAAMATSGAVSDADAINRFFADILLILNNLKGLIEPIVGLGIAIVIAQQTISLRRQKAVKEEQAAAKQERAAIATTLCDQNDKMAVIHDAVETVKAQVAPEVPKDYPT